MNGDLSNDTQDSSTSHDTADLRPDEDSVDSDKALNLVSIHLLPDIAYVSGLTCIQFHTLFNRTSFVHFISYLTTLLHLSVVFLFFSIQSLQSNPIKATEMQMKYFFKSSIGLILVSECFR